MHGGSTLKVSRGLGNLQRLILDGIESSPGRFDGILRWELAKRSGAIHDDELKWAFYSGFQRALGSLSQLPRPHLRIERRRLRSMDELVELYPHKTRSSTIRTLRLKILPLLRDSVASTRPRFDSIESERHVFENSIPTFDAPATARMEWEDGQKTWHSVDELIGGLFRTGTDCRPELLVELLTKGRELFDPRSGFRLEKSLMRILRDLKFEAARDPRVPAIVEMVKSLVDRWIPERGRAGARITAKLYRLVSFPRHGDASLHDQVKLDLWLQHRRLITRLPGHQDRGGRPGPKGTAIVMVGDPPKYSPLLDRIIQRDVLQDFVFLYPTR